MEDNFLTYLAPVRGIRFGNAKYEPSSINDMGADVGAVNSAAHVQVIPCAMALPARFLARVNGATSL